MKAGVFGREHISIQDLVKYDFCDVCDLVIFPSDTLPLEGIKTVLETISLSNSFILTNLGRSLLIFKHFGLCDIFDVVLKFIQMWCWSRYFSVFDVVGNTERVLLKP